MAPVPDPPHNNNKEFDEDSSHISYGGAIISSDEDEISNNGYQPLSQEEEPANLESLLSALTEYGVNNITSDGTITNGPDNLGDDAERDSVNMDTELSLTKDINKAMVEHMRELQEEQKYIWKDGPKHNIVMTLEKEKEIKRAMAGFVLPATNVPQWVFNVSDEEWKCKISSITKK